MNNGKAEPLDRTEPESNGLNVKTMMQTYGFMKQVTSYEGNEARPTTIK